MHHFSPLVLLIVNMDYWKTIKIRQINQNDFSLFPFLYSDMQHLKLFLIFFRSWVPKVSTLTQKNPLQSPGMELPRGDEREFRVWVYKLALPAIVWGFLHNYFWYILACHTNVWKQRHALINYNWECLASDSTWITFLLAGHISDIITFILEPACNRITCLTTHYHEHADVETCSYSRTWSGVS